MISSPEPRSVYLVTEHFSHAGIGKGAADRVLAAFTDYDQADEYLANFVLKLERMTRDDETSDQDGEHEKEAFAKFRGTFKYWERVTAGVIVHWAHSTTLMIDEWPLCTSHRDTELKTPLYEGVDM